MSYSTILSKTKKLLSKFKDNELILIETICELLECQWDYTDILDLLNDLDDENPTVQKFRNFYQEIVKCREERMDQAKVKFLQKMEQ